MTTRTLAVCLAGGGPAVDGVCPEHGESACVVSIRPSPAREPARLVRWLERALWGAPAAR